MVVFGPVVARTRFHLRDAMRLQTGRPAILLGVRTALATMVPQLLAPYAGLTIATWASLGGFVVSLVDKGGAYRMRAKMTGALAIGGTFAVLLGSLVAHSPVLDLTVMFVGSAACMLAGAWGPAATSVGNSIAVQLAIALARPMPPDQVWLPAVGFAIGGGLAMVIALVLWPVRVYAPVRRAVAAVLREVAGHARELASRRDVGSTAWRAELTARHRVMREAIETARSTLAAVRRGRRGESARGARLLVTVQLADRIVGTLVALEDVLDASGATPPAALARLADTLAALAAAVVDERGRAPAPPEAPVAPDASAADRLVARALADAAAAARMVDGLATASEPVPPIDLEDDRGPAPSALDVLRAQLHPDAVIFRHAVRVAVVATIGVLLGQALALHRGYWVTLTATLLLQPHGPATVTKGIQRIGGTVLGGVLAALLAAALHDPRAMIVAVGVLAAVTAAVLQLNYGLFSLFLTPTFVLLSEIHATDANLVEVRIVNTLLGAALAIAGSLVLWPHRERERLGVQLAAGLEAVRAYLAVALAAHAPPELARARRRVGLAFNNADLSFQRVLAEGGIAAPRAEAYMTLLLYGRRLSSAITALASVGDPAAGRPQAAALDAALVALAAAVRAERAPPDADLPAAPPRLVEQLTILYDAAARIA